MEVEHQPKAALEEVVLGTHEIGPKQVELPQYPFDQFRKRERQQPLEFEQQPRAENKETDLGTSETGPKQVRLPQYPLDQFGVQKRAFQKNWFDTFEWLEYSVNLNSTFCFSCRLFGKQHTQNNKDALISTGYSNWKRALDSFREHDKSALHKATMVSWKSYKASLTQGDVHEKRQTTSVSEII